MGYTAARRHTVPISLDKRRSLALRFLPIVAPLCLWAAVIFVTSCYFIDRDSFIAAIARWLPEGAVRGAWAHLWLVAGLLVIKGYHMTEYAVLFLLARAAISRTALVRRWQPAHLTAVAAMAGLAYAATDEWHQTFVPGRGGTVTDVLIDATGILIAVLFLNLHLRRRRMGVK